MRNTKSGEVGMKRVVKVRFPIWSTYEDEIELDIPDDCDPDTWLAENELEVIEGHWMCEGDMDGALDMGYAGVEFKKGEDRG